MCQGHQTTHKCVAQGGHPPGGLWLVITFSSDFLPFHEGKLPPVSAAPAYNQPNYYNSSGRPTYGRQGGYAPRPAYAPAAPVGAYGSAGYGYPPQPAYGPQQGGFAPTYSAAHALLQFPPATGLTCPKGKHVCRSFRGGGHGYVDGFKMFSKTPQGCEQNFC